MFPLVYQAGIFPAGRNRILPPRLDEGQTFYAPLLSNLLAIGAGSVTPTFARASVATYHNPSGELVSVGNGIPRFEKYGYLSEGSRTNIAKWSEDFTQGAIWIVNNVTIAGNVFASPYVGAPVIADKVQEDNTNNYHDVYQMYHGGANQKDSVAFDVHGGERTWLWFGWWDNDGKVVEVFFNTVTGTFGTTNVSGVGISIVKAPAVEQLTSGWWRVWFTVQTSTQTIRAIDVGPAQADNVPSYTGTTGWGIYVIAAQVEINEDFISSYIPTAAGTVTRAQDVLTYPGLGNTPLGAIGTIECVVRRRYLDNGYAALSTKDGVDQYGAEILFGVDTGQLLANVVSNALQQQALDANISVDTDAWCLWAFQPFTCGLYKDGVLGAIATTNSNLPYHSQINIGNAGTGGNELYGWVRSVKIWETRLFL